MLDDKTKQALLSARPFKYLDLHEIELIILYCEIKNFEAGEIVLHQGQKNNRMYIFLEGKALAEAEILGHGFTELAALKAGDFVGAESLIEEEISLFTVTAESPLQCFVMGHEYFQMLSHFLPDIRFKITTAIIENVSNDLDYLFKKIKTYMRDSDMATSWISSDDIFKFDTLPIPISFNESNLNKQELMQLNNLQNFTRKELDLLLTHAEVLDIPRNTTLVAENQQKDAYYVIVQGAIEACVLQNSKRAKVAILSPGELLGDICYLDQCPSVLHHVTRERTILLEFSKQNLDRLRTEAIPIWLKFYNLIGKSFISMEKSADKLFIRFQGEIYNR